MSMFQQRAVVMKNSSGRLGWATSSAASRLKKVILLDIFSSCETVSSLGLRDPGTTVTCWSRPSPGWPNAGPGAQKGCEISIPRDVRSSAARGPEQPDLVGPAPRGSLARASSDRACRPPLPPARGQPGSVKLRPLSERILSRRGQETGRQHGRGRAPDPRRGRDPPALSGSAGGWVGRCGRQPTGRVWGVPLKGGARGAGRGAGRRCARGSRPEHAPRGAAERGAAGGWRRRTSPAAAAAASEPGPDAAAARGRGGGGGGGRGALSARRSARWGAEPPRLLPPPPAPPGLRPRGEAASGEPRRRPWATRRAWKEAKGWAPSPKGRRRQAGMAAAPRPPWSAWSRPGWRRT